MKKIVFYITSFIFLILFTGCNNFLSGSNIDKTLKKAIDYANTTSCIVSINTANEGEGSVTPYGNTEIKIGFDYSINFRQNDDYEFIEWQTNSPNVIFEDAYDPETYFSINEASENIKIYPYAVKRISLIGQPTPVNNPIGVSRDRSILVTFSQPLAEKNFIFTQEEYENIKNDLETPDLTVEKIENTDGEIWAYKTTDSTNISQTYLKNISILSSEFSMAEHFLQPEIINENQLRIRVDNENPIPVDFGLKEINVNISKKIVNKITTEYPFEISYSIKDNGDIKWTYQVSETTDEKAFVTIKAQSNDMGTLYPPDVYNKSYNIGQRINLEFTEDANYQFIRWDYPDNIISLNNPSLKETMATVVDKNTESDTAQIIAICQPRLKVESFEPVNTDANPTVPKNSQISIKFDHDLPDSNDLDFIRILNNIFITVDGIPVNDSFFSPEIQNNNTLVFLPNNKNMISVTEGQIRNVSVYLPSNFYYVFTDTDGSKKKITIGGNGKYFSYQIDETTMTKATVNFSCNSESGTITKPNNMVNLQYSINQQVPLSFTLNDGYRFNSWKYELSGEALFVENPIKILNASSTNATLVINEAVSGINIIADTSVDLIATLTPENNTSASPRDSDIVINFNQPLNNKCTTAKKLNNIKISMDGENINEYYTIRSCSSDYKTITIKNTAPLNIQKGNTKQIIVTVPDDFYYTDQNNNNIHLEDTKIFSFNVNNTTNSKAKIQFKVVNGEKVDNVERTDLPEAGSITHSDYIDSQNNEFYIYDDINFEFKPNSAYQFYKWEIVDSNGQIVNQDIIDYSDSDTNKLFSKLKPMQDCSGIIVRAVCYQRPKVLLDYCSPNDTISSYPKNTMIQVRFNHAIADDCYDNIILSSDITFDKKQYYLSELSPEKNIIYISSKALLKLNNSTHTITCTIPYNEIYYYAEDNRTKIYTEAEKKDEKSWSFLINNTTVYKTNVKFNLDGAVSSGSQIYNITSSDYYSSGSQHSFQFNDEETVDFQFIPTTSTNGDIYKIIGWKVECDDSTKNDFEVSKTGNQLMGTIEVKRKNTDDVYFKMEINSNDPTKVTTTSYKAMGSDNNSLNHLKITASQYLVPSFKNYTPKYISTGVERDKPVSIEFNTTIDSSTVEFYDVNNEEGTLQIVSALNESIHYEEYVRNLEWDNYNKILTFNLDTSIIDEFEDKKTLDIKIILDGEQIKDVQGNSLEKTTEFTYRINETSLEKTKVNFTAGTNSQTGWIINVDGAQNTNNDLLNNYNLNQELEIECIPRNANEYKLVEWRVTNGDSSYVEIESPNLSKTKLKILKTSSETQTIQIEPVLAQMPIVNNDSLSPLYTPEGVNMDTPLIFGFNKAISSNTIALYDPATGNGNIQIVDIYNENIHYEQYFKAPYLDNTGKYLTIKSNGSKIHDIVPEDGKLGFKVILMSNIKENASTARTLKEIYGDEGFSTNFCYNSARNTTKPSLTGFSITRDSSVNTQLLKFTLDNSETGYESGTYTNDITVNHVKDSVYIKNFNCFDEYSGMKGVYIEETLVKKCDGTTCEIPVKINPDGYGTTPGKIDNNEITIYERLTGTNYGPGHYTASFTYPLQSKEDGIIKLVFRAINYADAISDQSYVYYVTRDTVVNVSDYYFTNEQYVNEYELLNTDIIDYPNIYPEEYPEEDKGFAINNASPDYLYDFVSSEDSWGPVKSDGTYNSDQITITAYWTKNDIQGEYDYAIDEDAILIPIPEKSGDISNNKHIYPITFGTIGVINGLFDYIPIPQQNETVDTFFIKIVMEDAVGNKKVKVYPVPGKGSLTEALPTNNSILFSFKPVQNKFNDFKYSNYVIRSYFDTSLESYNKNFATVLMTESDMASYIMTSYINSDFLYYSDKVYSYTSPEGETKHIYGFPQKFRIISTSNVNYTKGTSSNMNPVCSFEYTPGAKNSGVYHVVLDILNPNSNLTYYVNGGLVKGKIAFGSNSIMSPFIDCINNNNNIKRTEFDFKPSSSIYYFKVYGYDDVNKIYYENAEEATEIQILEDIVPPQKPSQIQTNLSYKTIETSPFTDSGVNKGIKTNSDEYIDVDYWFVPYESSWDDLDSSTMLTENQINSLNSNKLHTTYSSSTSSDSYPVKYPLHGIGNGEYVLIAKVDDVNGNYFCNRIKNISVNKFDADRQNSLGVTIYNTNATITFPVNTTQDKTHPDHTVTIYRSGSDDWTFDSELQDIQKSGSNYSATKSLSNDIWYKFTFIGHNNEMNNYSLLYSVPKYVFVTSDNLTCNTKTLNYRNNYMVNISCDIPCIVETLYSCIKYDTKEDWLTYGESSGIQCFNNEKNSQGTYNLIKDYYYPDTSKAVYGDYYVVAAHFADGTTQITEVKQK